MFGLRTFQLPFVCLGVGLHAYVIWCAIFWLNVVESLPRNDFLKSDMLTDIV